MSLTKTFDFGDESVARDYDAVIVPTLFYPWASRLVEQHRPWDGRRVLDVATGTGVVAQFVGKRVGPEGKVIGADINPQMLAAARRRCADLATSVEFVQTPAHPLQIPSNSIDVITCQQGFQFFPDRRAAAGEMHRVLRDGGKVIVSTWRSVSECRGFGVVCDALEAIGEPDIASSMRVPFDNMPQDELVEHFEAAGFGNIELEQHEIDMLLEQGPEQAIEVAYATPIGPPLRALPEERQAQFRSALTDLVAQSSNGVTNMGAMVSNLLTAEKTA